MCVCQYLGFEYKWLIVPSFSCVAKSFIQGCRNKPTTMIGYCVSLPTKMDPWDRRKTFSLTAYLVLKKNERNSPMLPMEKEMLMPFWAYRRAKLWDVSVLRWCYILKWFVEIFIYPVLHSLGIGSNSLKSKLLGPALWTAVYDEGLSFPYI